jgi:hypothetical protein
MRGNGQHRDTTALAVVKAVDEVHVAGPQLPAQTASSPVKWACAPAAKAPVSSWRTAIHSISGCFAISSRMPLSESPTTPKTRLTPAATRVSTTMAAMVFWDMAGLSFEAGFIQ